MQGIGIDAVDIERFRTALERTPLGWELLICTTYQ